MQNDEKVLNIGLVMPIAAIDDYSAEHWKDVKSILVEAVSNLPGYITETKIVSEGESIGLIHKRIVQGLYNSDIVICDVSCKNPNVMFELGLRLAFDKPTIIVKDDRTPYSFDTGVIEHLEYPRDLRFNRILDFKAQLANRVLATYENSKSDSEYSPFLKSFGTFKIATIEQTETSADRLILETVLDVQTQIAGLKSEIKSEIKVERQASKIVSIDLASLALALQSEVYIVMRDTNKNWRDFSYTDLRNMILSRTKIDIVLKASEQNFRTAMLTVLEYMDDVLSYEKN
ncbi:hypothetical protein [Paenibacillus durus]|uniref:hypothetical protein n=1 Tax=Paenibacillus durus TaxID=44251 RepID=UPI000693D08C|nr:hypothetical protein [Paenibacillus durus]